MTLVSNPQSGSYTLVLSDADKVIDMTSGSAVTLTVPTNASVAFPVGTVLEVCQAGAGQVTIAGAPSVLASDAFDRADSASSLGSTAQSQAWVVGAAVGNPDGVAAGVTGGRAYFASRGSADPASGLVAIVDSGQADVTVTCDMPVFPGNAGIYVRAVSVTSGILVVRNGTSLDVWSQSSGSTYNLLSATLGNGCNPVNGDTVSVVTSGTAITVKKNGTTLYTVTSSFNQTATKHGIRTDGNNLAARFDNFTVTAAASSPLPVRERQNRLKTAGQYAYATLRKVGTDEWHVAGDVAA